MNKLNKTYIFIFFTLVISLTGCSVLCNYYNFIYQRFLKSWETGFNHESYDEPIKFLNYLENKTKKSNCSDSLNYIIIEKKKEIIIENKIALKIIKEAPNNPREFLFFALQHPYSPLNDTLTIVYKQKAEEYIDLRSTIYEKIAEHLEEKLKKGIDFKTATNIQNSIQKLTNMDTISKKDVSKLSKSIRVFENWIKNNYKKEDYSGLENFELNEKRILLLQSRLFDELLKEHLKVLDNSSNNNAIEFTKQEMSKTFDFQRNFVTVQEVNLIDKRKEEFYNHIAITYNYVIKAKRNISILGFVIDHDEQNIKIEVKANINTGNGLFINDSFIVNVAKM